MAIVAQSWKNLDTGSGLAIAKSVVQSSPIKYTRLLEGICEIINSSSIDLYGTNAEEKYQRIVQLILERTESVIKDNVSELSEIDLQTLYEDIINNISTNNKLDSKLIIKNISEIIIQKIQEEYINFFSNYEDELISFLNIQFKNQIDQNKKQIDNSKQQIESEQNNSTIEENSEQLDNNSEKKEQNNTESENTETEINFNTLKNLLTECTNTLLNVSTMLSKISIKSIKNLNSFNKDLLKTLNIGYNNINEEAIKIYNNSNSANVFKNINKTVDDIMPTKKEKKLEEEKNNSILAVDNLIKEMQSLTEKTIANLFPTYISILFTKALPQFLKFIGAVFLLLTGFFITFIGILWVAIKPTFDKYIQPIIDALKKEIEKIKNAIKTVYEEAISPFIDYVLNEIGPPLERLLNAIKNVIVNVFNAIKDDLVKIFDKFVEIGKNIFECLKLFSEGFGSRSEQFYALFRSFIDIINITFERFINGFLKVKDKLGDILGDITSALSRICEEFLEGFKTKQEAILSRIDNLKILFDNILNKFMTGYNSFMEEHSSELDKFSKELEKFKECFEIIGTKFSAISQSVEDILIAYNNGLNKHAKQLADEQTKYMQLCYKIDQMWGVELKDAGESMGELQGKVISGILDILEFSGGSIFNLIVLSKLNRIKEALTFWKTEEHVPTPVDIIDKFKEIDDSISKLLTKLHENNMKFWIKKYEHGDYNGDIYYWIDLLYKDFYWTLDDITGAMLLKGFGLPRYAIKIYNDLANIAVLKDDIEQFNSMKTALFSNLNQLKTQIKIIEQQTTDQKDIKLNIKNQNQEIKNNKTPIETIQTKNEQIMQKINDTKQQLLKEFNYIFNSSKNIYFNEISKMSKIKQLINDKYRNIDVYNIDLTKKNNNQNLAMLENL